MTDGCQVDDKWMTSDAKWTHVSTAKDAVKKIITAKDAVKKIITSKDAVKAGPLQLYQIKFIFEKKIWMKNPISK